MPSPVKCPQDRCNLHVIRTKSSFGKDYLRKMGRQKTYKYYKCRKCDFRVSEDGDVLTLPGGVLA